MKERSGPWTTLKMEDDPELFFALDQYRRSTGWTWKRCWLMGMARVIEHNGDNPDLVIKIINYMSEKR